MKFMRRHGHKRVWKWPVIWRGGVMLALALLGGMAVAYCVRYGYSILVGLDTPVGLLESLTGLLRLAL